MLEAFYGLRTDPFGYGLGNGSMFLHHSLERAKSAMEQAHQSGAGILVITGRPGTGKSTLVESYIRQQSPANLYCATLPSTRVQHDDFLRLVAYAIEAPAEDIDQATLIHGIAERLQTTRGCLLIVDEAQHLPFEALEDLRLLTNLQHHGRPLLQVFMLGQPELNQILHDPQLEQFHQRISACCVIEPLSVDEVYEYVIHRLLQAGWHGKPHLSSDVIVIAHRFSHGLPRYLNKFFSRLLLKGAIEERAELNLEDALSIALEFQAEHLLPLTPASEFPNCEELPAVQGLIDKAPLPLQNRLCLSASEAAFLSAHPDGTVAPARPAPRPQIAPPAKQATVATEHRPLPAKASSSTASLFSQVQARTQQWAQQSRQSISHAGANVNRWRLQASDVVRSHLAAGPLPQQHQPLALATTAVLIWIVIVNFGSPGVAQAPEDLSLTSDHHAGPIVILPDPVSVPNTDALQEIFVTATRIVATPIAPPEPAPIEIALPKSTGSEPVMAFASMAPAAAPALPDSDPVPRLDLPPGPELTLVSVTATPLPLLDPPLPIPAVSEIDRLLDKAATAFEDDRLRIPEGNNAWQYYLDVLALEPDNAIATAGLQRIAARYYELAMAAFDAGNIDSVRVFIRRGLGVVPKEPKLTELAEELDQRQAMLAAALITEQAPAEPLLAEEEAPPERRGLFGRLKQFFSGGKRKEPADESPGQE